MLPQTSAATTRSALASAGLRRSPSPRRCPSRARARRRRRRPRQLGRRGPEEERHVPEDARKPPHVLAPSGSSRPTIGTRRGRARLTPGASQRRYVELGRCGCPGCSPPRSRSSRREKRCRRPRSATAWSVPAPAVPGPGQPPGGSSRSGYRTGTRGGHTGKGVDDVGVLGSRGLGHRPSAMGPGCRPNGGPLGAGLVKVGIGKSHGAPPPAGGPEETPKSPLSERNPGKYRLIAAGRGRVRYGTKAARAPAGPVVVLGGPASPQPNAGPWVWR